jgi:tetratricopeptide (TPR) repeat protein
LSNKPERTKEDDKLLIELITKWGYTLHLRADFVGLSNLFTAHEAMVESHASKEQLVMFYGWLGFALGRREKLQDGYQYLRKALHIAEEIGNIKGVGYCCAWLTHACNDMGLLEEAIIFGERARETANHFESDHYLFGMAFMFSAYAHFFRGDVKKTAEIGQALLDYGRKHSDLPCIARHYAAIGFSRFSAGDFPSAIEYLKKGIQVQPDLVTSHATKMLLGGCYLTTGQLQEAQSTLAEVIEYSEKFGYEIVRTASQAMRGMVLISQGDLKQGMSLYENAMQTIFECKSLYRYAVGNQLMGRVYSKIVQGEGGRKDFSFLIKNIVFLIKTVPFAHKKAEEHFTIAIKTAKEIGAKGVLAQASLDMGLLHKIKGRKEQARKYITDAIQLFEECEADVFLKQAKEALASLN